MRARHVQVLVGLTVIAAAVRFATLDVQSFWLDEAVTVRLMRMSFGDMLGQLPNSESNPPLFYIVEWLWAKAFGTGEVGLRSLSALCGTAAIPVFYAAAAELVSRRAGLVVAALAAVNPLLVWYSQEARSYGLLMLLGALSFWLFARARAAPSTKTLAAWSIVSALAILTHYFAAFLVGAEAVWLIATLTPRRGPILASALPACVGAALIPLAADQADHPLFIEQISLLKRLARTPKQFLVGFSGPSEVALAIAAAVLVLAALWLLLARTGEDERRGVRVAAAVGIAAVGVPLVLAVCGLDYWDTRNLLAAWLPLAVVVGAGLGARQAGRLGLVLAAALCAVSLMEVVGVDVDARYQRDDWRGLARALGPTPPGGRVIAVTPASGRIPLQVYLRDAHAVPPARGRVRYLALAALGGAGRQASTSSTPPRPASVPPPLPGLTEVRRDYAKTFSLVEFRAAAPQLVAPGAFIVTPLDPTHRVTVLLQPASRR